MPRTSKMRPLLRRNAAKTKIGSILWVLPQVSSAQGFRTSRRNLTVKETNQESKSEYPGCLGAPFTTKLSLETEWDQIPIFRVTDENGTIIEKDYSPALSDDKILELYKLMVQTNEMDKRFYDAQRQGRLSFYMTSFGEEGTHVGSASALHPDDMIFAQYREVGVFLYRGYTLQNVANQCLSNALDLGKGRQMPVHYGARKWNLQTISSPLGTQLPQAVGAAYAYKRAKKPNIVICYFGEGAASEGDFHTALNFSSTLEAPVVFFCRNNGYAISTPTREQFRGDGIAGRGRGYGVATIRCDGNCVLAVHETTKAAREYALQHSRPVLVEALTYRGGHHSTSDDSSRYRESSEIKFWNEQNHPITRTRLLLESKQLWDADQEMELKAKCRKEVLAALTQAERQKKPPISQMFTDVYSDLPRHLQEQQAELQAHMKEYQSSYPILKTFLPEEAFKDPSQDRSQTPPPYEQYGLDGELAPPRSRADS